MSDRYDTRPLEERPSAAPPSRALPTPGSLPTRVAYLGGGGLVIAAMLGMVSSGINALTLEVGVPIGVVPIPDAEFPEQTLRFVDRLGLFVQAGPSLFWTLLLAIALVVIALGQDGAAGPTRDDGLRPVIWTAAGLAAVISVSCLAMVLVVVTDARFNAYVSGRFASNRTASVSELLGPIVLSAGVVWYAAGRLRPRGPLPPTPPTD